MSDAMESLCVALFLCGVAGAFHPRIGFIGLSLAILSLVLRYS